MKLLLRPIWSLCLIGTLVIGISVGLVPKEVRGQSGTGQRNNAIVVHAEQPNVWTLEQAHYLLEQMHRRDLDLKAKSLEELDPNEINGLHFEVLKTLVELGVKFDQAEAATNKRLSHEQNLQENQRQTLLTQRDQLQTESLDLTREIARLQIKKANATAQEDKDRFDAEIAAKTAERDTIDKQLQATNTELGTVTAPTGQLKSTQAEGSFEANKLPTGLFEEAVKGAAKSQIDKFGINILASVRGS